MGVCREASLILKRPEGGRGKTRLLAWVAQLAMGTGGWTATEGPGTSLGA